MWKFVAPLFLLLCFPAWALVSIVADTHHTVSTFTGVGDVVSGAKGHWGTIAYSSGNPTATLLRLCQVDTVTGCGDVAAVAGFVSSTQTGPYSGTPCDTGAHVCVAVTLYDDSGASNCSGACNMTGGSPTKFIPNAVGSIPALHCNAANSANASWATVTPSSTGASLINGINVISNISSGNDRIFSFNDTGGVVMFDNSSLHAAIFGGSVLASSGTLSSGTTYALIADIATDGSGGISINGTRTSGTVGSNTLNTSVAFCGGNSDAQAVEFGAYAVQLDGTQRTNITSKMRANGGY